MGEATGGAVNLKYGGSSRSVYNKLILSILSIAGCSCTICEFNSDGAGNA
jgi:hypothetical protein